MRNAAGDAAADFEVGVFDDDGKIVATDAGGEIGGAERAGDAAGAR